MPKARGQVFAIGLSRRDAFKIAAALNTMETADKTTHDTLCKEANMKLSGVDKLFMETRNEELRALRKEVFYLKKELAQRSDNKTKDALALCKDLSAVSRVYLAHPDFIDTFIKRAQCIVRSASAVAKDDRRKPCKCGRIDYGPIICAKCGGAIWQES